jgi:hypothetical protein
MQQLFSGRITQFSKQCRSQSVWTDLSNTKWEINPEGCINTEELINQSTRWWNAISIHEINLIVHSFPTTFSKRHQYKAIRSKNIEISQMISELSGKRSSKLKLHKPQFFNTFKKFREGWRKPFRRTLYNKAPWLILTKVCPERFSPPISENFWGVQYFNEHSTRGYKQRMIVGINWVKTVFRLFIKCFCSTKLFFQEGGARQDREKRAKSQPNQQYNNFPVEEVTSSVTIADHNLSEQLHKPQFFQYIQKIQRIKYRITVQILCLTIERSMHSIL